MTSKFTLNYGVRWDYYTPSREKYNHFSFVDLVGKKPDGIPGRLAFAGNNGACQAQSSCFGAPYPETPWHKGFAPRLGVAYAWDQKTVVRAGYGIFFGQAFYPGWGGGMSLDGFNEHQTFGTSPERRLDEPSFLFGWWSPCLRRSLPTDLFRASTTARHPAKPMEMVRRIVLWMVTAGRTRNSGNLTIERPASTRHRAERGLRWKQGLSADLQLKPCQRS